MGLSRGIGASTNAKDAAASPPPKETSILKAFPLVGEFLSDPEWEDGTARRTGTLLLFAEEGRWKAMLNDRDAGAVAFVSGVSLVACLASIEEGLADCSLDWRVSRSTGKGKRS